MAIARWWSFAALLFCAAALAEPSVEHFTPTGHVDEVRQVKIVFTDAMVPLGNPTAADPVVIDCKTKDAGFGSWIDQRTWTWNLAPAGGPGTSCSFSLRPNLMTADGHKLTGQRSFSFDVPALTAIETQHILQSLPYGNQRIAQDQIFGIRFAQAASSAPGIECQVEDGERKSASVIAAPPHAAEMGPFLHTAAGSTYFYQCPGSLPLGKNIAIALPRGSLKEERLPFTVRDLPLVTAQCRSAGNAASCPSFQPLTLVISGTVDVAANHIFLRGPDGVHRPVVKQSPYSIYSNIGVTTLTFQPPFQAGASYEVEYPDGIRSVEGLPLADKSLHTVDVRAVPTPMFASGSLVVLPTNHALLPVYVNAHAASRPIQQFFIDAGASAPKADTQLFDLVNKREFGDRDAYRQKLNGEDGVTGRSMVLHGSAPVGKFGLFTSNLDLKNHGVHFLEMRTDDPSDNRMATFDRTMVQVTDLAVHVRQSRDNLAIWVTQLADGTPVRGAEVAYLGCSAVRQTGITDASGTALLAVKYEVCPAEWRSRKRQFMPIVTARARDSRGAQFSFMTLRNSYDVLNQGQSYYVSTESRDHVTSIGSQTVLQRGETLQMHHVLRRLETAGWSIPIDDRPKQVTVRNDAGDHWTIPLTWTVDGDSDTTFKVPGNAKLGQYAVTTSDGTEARWSNITETPFRFEVAPFQVPAMVGTVASKETHGMVSGVRPMIGISLAYADGSAAKGWPVKVRTTVTGNGNIKWPAGFLPDYSYDQGGIPPLNQELDLQDLALDEHGEGRLTLPSLPAALRPYTIQSDLSYADPNGKQQTLTQVFTVMPGPLVIGLERRTKSNGELRLRAVVLNAESQPVPHQQVDINVETVVAPAPTAPSSSKAAFGSAKPLCSKETDSGGFVECTYAGQGTSMRFSAHTKASDGYLAEATSDQNSYAPVEDNLLKLSMPDGPYNVGDTLNLEINSKFGEGWAWVTVERDGVLLSQTLPIHQEKAALKLVVEPGWSGGVQVTVVAIDKTAPTIPTENQVKRIAEAKAEVAVTRDVHAMNVVVSLPQARFRPREDAATHIKVTFPDGTPVPGHTRVVLAVMDQGLLELRDNQSFNVLDAILSPRHSQSAFLTLLDGLSFPKLLALLREQDALKEQNQPRLKEKLREREQELDRVTVTGSNLRRADVEYPSPVQAFSAPAPAPNERNRSSSASPTRVDFKPVVLWRSDLFTDAAGNADIKVPLNDSLGRFKLVAVAILAPDRFGTGSHSIDIVKDIELRAGLSTFVRSGDTEFAQVTVRNTTLVPRNISISALHDGKKLDTQEVTIGAGDSQSVQWPITVDAIQKKIAWSFTASDGTEYLDSIAAEQAVLPAVPITVQNATLEQVSKPIVIPVGSSADALPNSRSVMIGLTKSLAVVEQPVDAWFREYPYSCFEQRFSKSIVLGDDLAFDALMQDVPRYLASDNLLVYFPYQQIPSYGSDTLTSYVLNVAFDAKHRLPSDVENKLLSGLTAFIAAGATSSDWRPPHDDHLARRLAALATLARYGRTNPVMLHDVRIDQDEWTASMLIDWLTVLQSTVNVPDQQKAIATIDAQLHARLSFFGVRATLSTERRDYWWWLMDNGDVDMARLYLAIKDLPDWQSELPKLYKGLVGRQLHGVWAGTVANVWGILATRQFVAHFESAEVTGVTSVTGDGHAQSFAWKDGNVAQLELPLPDHDSKVALSHDGSGAPWATISVLAAVPLEKGLFSGYRIEKTIQPLQQAKPGTWSPGDVLRVTLHIIAQTDMTWVVVNDPIPAGASLLGTGLKRDQSALTNDEHSTYQWSSYVERDADAYKAYYQFMPAGAFSVEYTIRLNSAGQFHLPPTRVEGMYASEVYGALPNATSIIAAPSATKH